MAVGNGTLSNAYHASIRFGFGPRLGEQLPSDPVSWLMDQLSGPDPSPAGGFPNTSGCLGLYGAFVAAPMGSQAKQNAAAAISQLFQAEVQSALSNYVLTAAPFRERLVMFWTNHFAVMAATDPTAALAGDFMREAIRPNVLGSFAQMVEAVVAHPAMNYSLNNNNSVGTLSTRAVNAAKRGVYVGLNENLGRELLELYTVSLAAGYQQADVDAMANLLAGVKIQVSPQGGGTYFDPQSCNKGNQVLMGVTYPNTQAGLASALTMLGTNAHSYANIAFELVKHFVSDTPEPSDVATVQQALVSSHGNLAAAAAAVVGLSNAWVPLTKIRTPADIVLAALRATGTTSASMPANVDNPCSAMGMPTWRSQFPNGWSDVAADWVAPGSMSTRVGFLNAYAQGFPSINVSSTAQAVLGPLVSQGTLSAIAGASTPAAKLATLFCSPEFQRR